MKPGKLTLRSWMIYAREQRIIDGIGECVWKLYKDLGFNNILRKNQEKTQWNAILKSCVLGKTVAQSRKQRRTASMLEQDYGVRIPLEQIYRMMDHVADQEEDIKKKLWLTQQGQSWKKS